MKNIWKDLAWLNTIRSSARSIGIVVLIFFLAFSLYFISYLTAGMNNGIRSMEDKLGADIIVLPMEVDENEYQGALINGEPSHFMMDDRVINAVNGVQGVQKCSPQVFVATISASCCAFPVQVIGIDFETDFSVTSWLQDDVELPLQRDQILVGRNIVAQTGAYLPFFDHKFFVAGSFSETGMGFDNSVFMGIEDARMIAAKAPYYSFENQEEQENMISSVMVKVDKDFDARVVARDIDQVIKEFNAKTEVTRAMFTDIARQMTQYKDLFILLLALLWGLGLVVLMVVFQLMIRGRRREWIALRILGATKKQLSRLIITESLILGAIGALTGTVFALIVQTLFNTTIQQRINLPFLEPNREIVLLLIGVTIGLCILIGPISSFFGVRNLYREEIAVSSNREG
ncbi:MAG: FtsX-like permease family protein [Tissierellia bacterium]|nr:FtsX-like permease family protein [Tissierellia bacterium]